MFNFLKFAKLKTGPPRNSDFDVLSSVTVGGVTVERDEVIHLLLVWTHDNKRVSMAGLGLEVERYCKGFRKKYNIEGTVLRNTHGQLFARHIIRAYMNAGVLSKENAYAYKLTRRGEQVRQFYVLLTGRRDTFYDRMNEFRKAK